MNVENIEVTTGHSVAVLGQVMCLVVKQQYQCNCPQYMGVSPPRVSNMKMSNIYSIIAAFIFVCILVVSNGFHDDEGESETANFINTPITEIPKIDDVDFSACH
jgi:hypothetical protein